MDTFRTFRILTPINNDRHDHVSKQEAIVTHNATYEERISVPEKTRVSEKARLPVQRLKR